MLWREVVSEKEVIDNYMEFFEEVAIPNVPKYIFGHSLGGLYAIRMS
jgi:alpha-beta hydrolase superfamily lysophospholipase